jgi:tetratricopeptide (TPR) repeat protein
MGQYDRALPLYENALEILKSELGDRHPNTAISLNNLAKLYQSMGYYDRALQSLEAALEILKSELGDRHPDTAACLGNLAELYQSMGNDSEAEAFYKRAVSICEELGTDHPISFTVLGNLINLYFSNSEYRKAGALLTKWLEIFYKELPTDHPKIQDIQDRLADLKKSGLYNPKFTPKKPANPKAFGAKSKKGKK